MLVTLALMDDGVVTKDTLITLVRKALADVLKAEASDK